MEQKERTTWREETALTRFQIIAPLLDSSLDRDKKSSFARNLPRRTICPSRPCAATREAFWKRALRD